MSTVVNALIAGLVSTLAVVAFFVGIYVVVERPGDLSDRLETYAAVAYQKDGEAGKRRKGFARLLEQLDRLLSGQAVTQRLALQLAQANVRTTVPEFLVILFSVGVVGGAIAFVIQRQFVSGVGGAVIGLAVPWFVLQRKRSKRINAFHDQLVDVLALVVGSLRGGHALLTALDLVSKELPPPASEEFSRVLREIGYGLSQSEALNNLVVRMETDDLQLVVTAVNISHEVGGNLSMVLEKIAETIRERIRLQGEIRVLTTQQRLTTYLLVALPFVLATIMAVINPQWMMRLVQPGPVRLIPIVALVFEGLGFFIAQRLTRIEV